MGLITSENLTIGKGQVQLAKHASLNPTALTNGFRDIGNAPGLSLNIATEKLEHFSSRGGIRQKDDSTTVQVTRTGTLQFDDMDPENLAMLFLGQALSVAASSASNKTETFTAITLGYGYQLGQTALNPSGDRAVSIDSVTLAAAPNTPLVLNTDYEIDLARGFIRIKKGSTLFAGGHLATGFTVTYDVAASTRKQVISGGTEFVGAMQYHAYNPKGANLDYFFPYVKLSPSGDLALIGEEYMTGSFSVEALPLGDLPAILLNGQPV
jgi:hypothetical protein